MSTVLNGIGYQLVWFAAVLGAARGLVAWGLAAAALFGVLHLATSARRSEDARLALLAVVLGSVLDGGLSLSGLVEYRATASPWPPAWLLAIWAAFGLTVNHSFAWSQRHLAATAAVGALGGPLAYLAAARLGAISVLTPTAYGVMALAVAWSVALPLLAAVARSRRHLPCRRPGGMPA